jgi:hypothetical protein
VNCVCAMLALASAFIAAHDLLAQSRSSDSGPCADCHPAQSRSYHRNGMSKALQRAEKSDILRMNAALEFSEGPYRTSITSDDRGSTLTVTDGKDTLTARMLWAFGLGRAGQTYVFEHAGKMFESRVSYYEALRGLDLTMGAHGSKPASLTEAAGRRMDSSDVRQCFGCHSTGGIRKNEVVWERMTPGISCENCHANAAQHVKARRSGVRKTGVMQSLRSLSAEEMNELCGACHRTWAQVAEMKLPGPLNVRFQPYRITNSKCFDADDRRIGCTACHDPHSELVKTAADYDSACLSCHALTPIARKAAVKSGKVCHTAKKDCVTCHMPKVTLPGAHYDFADHQIRVAKPGDPYPN